MTFSSISLLTAQNVYMLATQSAMKVFELSTHLPPEDVDTLRALVIESSSKVCTHLNQAWQNRETPEIFVSNIRVARIEARKTLEHIESVTKAKYADAAVCCFLKGAYENLIRQISDMMQGAE